MRVHNSMQVCVCMHVSVFTMHDETEGQKLVILVKVNIIHCRRRPDPSDTSSSSPGRGCVDQFPGALLTNTPNYHY